MAITWSDLTVPTTGGLDFRDFVEDTAHAILCGIGGTGLTYTTTDAVTYTARTASEANNLRGIAFAPTLGTSGRLCAVASSGTHRVTYSDDGAVTWLNADIVEANSWQSIDWVPWLNGGAGLFWAVASSGTHRVMTSPDGMHWTNQTAAAAKTWCGTAHSSTTLMAVSFSASTQQVMTSTDAVTWVLQTTAAVSTSQVGAASGRSVLAYSPPLDLFAYVAQGAGARFINISADQGVTWVARALPTNRTWTGIAWFAAGARFVIPSQSTGTYVAESTDGVTFTESSTGLTNQSWDCVGCFEGQRTVVAWGQSSNTHMLTGVLPLPPPPTATTPDTGSIAGGTAVTITGTGFAGTPTVTFGGVPATSVVVVNATTITCVIPAHAAGLVDVSVDGGVLVDGFTYTAAPLLRSISPDTGPILGGTAVTITGENFAADMTLVLTDGAGATLILLDRVDISATVITGTMPAHAAGPITLAAQNAAGAGSLVDAYTYTNDFAAGDDVFGAYALLRNDTALGFTERVNQPSTITYTALGTGDRPLGLQPIRLVDPVTSALLGTGLNLQITQTFEDTRDADQAPHRQWAVTATDRRWLMNRRLVTGVWDKVSASIIVRQVLASFAPAFSAAGVEDGLDPISISAKRDLKVADFLDAVCSALGGATWFLDPEGDVVHLGFELGAGLNPTPITDANRAVILHESSIEYSEDWSQIRNRVHVKGQYIKKQEGTFQQQPNFNGPAFAQDTLVADAGDMDMTGGAWTADYLLAYVLGPALPVAIHSTQAGVDTTVTCSGRVEYQVGESVTIAGVDHADPDVNGSHTVTAVNGNTFTIGFSTTAPGVGGSVVSNEPTGGLALGYRVQRVYTAWAPVSLPVSPTDPIPPTPPPLPPPGGFPPSVGGIIPPPATIPALTSTVTGVPSSRPEPVAGHTYAVRYTFSNGISESSPSPASNTTTAVALAILHLDADPEVSTVPGVYRVWYVSKDGAAFVHKDGGAGPNEEQIAGLPVTRVAFRWDLTGVPLG